MKTLIKDFQAQVKAKSLQVLQQDGQCSFQLEISDFLPFGTSF